MTKDVLLAIDNGTQSIRVLLFDLHGNLLEIIRTPIEPYFSIQPGWAEQHPDYYWQKICQSIQELWIKTDIPKDAIVGIALTTQRGTVVNVDKAGKPLRPAMVWLDQRRTEGLRPIRGLWGLGFRLAGMSETAAYLQSEAEANWIQTHQPDIWDQTHKYLYLSGYLSWKLSGRFVDSLACQVGYMPFDYKRLDWAKSWDWKWAAVPVRPELLPELVPPGDAIGQITKQAANETGLPEGLPIIAAAADKACEVIGAGCLEPQIGCLSYGTTATINTTHKRYIEVIPLIPPFPSAVPGSYSLEFQVYRGFWMVSWFKNEFAHREQIIANERGINAESLFDDLVNNVPPGSMGLILQPYWSPGLKTPGPEAKGAIIGFGDVHTRAHMYRAILEGLAYALRDGKERSERRSRIPITGLRVSGGGSQSDSAMQITADIFGLPTARPHLYETSGLGAGIDLAVGLGLYSDFDSAVKGMTRIGDVFEPNPRTREIYDGLYHKVYQQMYKRLKPLYDEIRDLTGYPSRLV
jgi:sugar (pentulose or hexulose) kinase